MTDVVLCECFARDGLQHETEFVPTETKRALIERFAALGFQRIEATSYSNPKVVPQFADASELLESLPRRDGVHYKATCANVRAVERALADLEAGFGVTEISLLVSASEAHSEKNLQRSRAPTQWDNVAQDGRGGAGPLPPDRHHLGRVRLPVRRRGRSGRGGRRRAALRRGRRRPRRARRHDRHGDAGGDEARWSAASQREAPASRSIAHSTTRAAPGSSTALAAYEAGVRYFDCSFGGVGGHPAQVKYGGGYTGNVCTEDLVNLFESLGIRTGIDLDRLDRDCALLRADARPRASRPGDPQRAEPALAASEPGRVTIQVAARGYQSKRKIRRSLP